MSSRSNAANLRMKSGSGMKGERKKAFLWQIRPLDWPIAYFSWKFQRI
jgi:hypothetical protein